MARAGTVFDRLALGSFSGLSVGYNEKDEPYLLGVRPSEETVPVEGMSDGTRDQLYLSLRIATLAKFLEHNEPMPLIVDDILIRFDDERARATLDVLTELAVKTQVLFFTHHSRLFEFAQSFAMTGKVRALSLPRQSIGACRFALSSPSFEADWWTLGTQRIRLHRSLETLRKNYSRQAHCLPT